jgi:hypothetical protein
MKLSEELAENRNLNTFKVHSKRVGWLLRPRTIIHELESVYRGSREYMHAKVIIQTLCYT